VCAKVRTAKAVEAVSPVLSANQKVRPAKKWGALDAQEYAFR
jgi:hypothetical protein